MRSFWRAIVDTVRGAVGTLAAHKLRSALTLLGIVIGIVTVVAMAATVEGLRRKIHADLAQLGTGVFQVQKWPVGGFRHGRDRAKYERRKNFTLADVALLQDRCTQCLRVAGEDWKYGESVSAGDKSTRPVEVAGGTADFFDNNGFALASGRFFGEGEAMGGAPVAVLGADVADVLFPGEDPLGRTVRVKQRTFRVIGVLERRGANLGGFSQDNLVVLPIAAFLPLFGGRGSLNLTVQVRDPARMAQAQDEVVAILRRARGVPPEAENDFEMFSNESMQENFETMTGTIQRAAIGITAISLLIGGIGVMNIMLVAVTERTSEIGLRRALGARRRRILGQFVTEAMFLTAAGGVLGVLLGAGVAALIRILAEVPTVVPASAIVLAILSAATVGLVFGIYPAWRASRLDPAQAMRQE